MRVRYLFAIIRSAYIARCTWHVIGEVPEWTIGAVSKTVVVLAATVGSNPTLSADYKIPQGSLGCTYCRT
jgi:hypothetical protein